jgi:hypothetical protein
METDPVLVPKPLVDTGAYVQPRRAGSARRGRIQTRRPRSWWWWAIRALGTVALAGLIAYGVHVHTQQQQADRSLASARAQLHDDVVRLGGARIELAGLATRSAAAGATLAGTEGQLESLQNNLSRAEANEFFSGVNIADLDQCLAGVERALNQISLSDPTGAASTLAGVSAVCSSAEPTA